MSNWTPTTKDVATVLMARTRDRGGKLVKDFTDATAVTQEQALAAIEDAVNELAPVVGEVHSDEDVEAAKRVAKYLAAANIEMSVFPDQASQNNSMYDKLINRVTSLREQLSSTESAEDEESGEEDVTGAFGGFPNSRNWNQRRW